MTMFPSDVTEALRSLDEDKILRASENNGVPVPSDPATFWASVHKARVQNPDMTEAEKFNSRQWLRRRGWTVPR